MVRPHRVVSFASGFPQLVASRIAQHLKLPHTPLTAIESILDKSRFRTLLETLNLPAVPFSVVTNLADAVKCSSELGYPQIFKPATGGMGSIGVTRVDDENGVKSALERAIDGSNDGCVLIEKFIEGIHLSYTGLIADGEWKYTALGRKLIHPEGRFIPVGAAQGPEPCEKGICDAIDRIFKTIAEHLGFEHTTLRADVIYDPDAELAYFIEMEIALATPLLLAPVSHGYDLLGNSLKTALRFEVENAGPHKYGAAVKYFMHPTRDFIKRGSIDEIINNKNIIELNLDTQKYQYEIDGISQYVWGRVVTKCDNRSNAIALAIEIEKNLEFVYN